MKARAATKEISYSGSAQTRGGRTLIRVMENQGKLTQEDVDTYNEIIGSLPEREKALVDAYSAARTELLRKHVPNTSVAEKPDGETSKG